MSRTIQWTKSLASGSSTRSTSEAAPAGTPDQLSAGDTFSPSHVYSRGIAPPSMNARAVSRNGTTGPDGEAEPRGEAEAAGCHWHPCPVDAVARAGDGEGTEPLSGTSVASSTSPSDPTGRPYPQAATSPITMNQRHREPSPERAHRRRASPPAVRGRQFQCTSSSSWTPCGQAVSGRYPTNPAPNENGTQSTTCDATMNAVTSPLQKA